MYRFLVYIVLVISIVACGSDQTLTTTQMDAPVYPDATNTSEEMQQNERVVTFETRASVKEVREFYVDEMLQRGWELGFSIADQQIFNLLEKHEGNKSYGRTVLIRTFPLDVGTRVQLRYSSYTETRYDK